MSRSLLAIAIAGAMALASMQSAAAQCAASERIYIDPRLVPKRPQISRENIVNLMANDFVSEEIKRRALDSYYNQHQPIQLPYRNGYVLVSAIDPCIQQYVPR
jgi:hypothetical protein